MVNPMGRAIRFFKGRQWKPSSEEKRALERIFLGDYLQPTVDASQPIVISWNDGDAENPQNWPAGYRIFVVFVVSSVIISSDELWG